MNIDVGTFYKLDRTTEFLQKLLAEAEKNKAKPQHIFILPDSRMETGKALVGEISVSLQTWNCPSAELSPLELASFHWTKCRNRRARGGRKGVVVVERKSLSFNYHWLESTFTFNSSLLRVITPLASSGFILGRTKINKTISHPLRPSLPLSSPVPKLVRFLFLLSNLSLSLFPPPLAGCFPGLP